MANRLVPACPDDPAFGNTSKCDFTKGKCDLFEIADGTKLTYNNNGAVFSIKSAGDAPTVKTTKYIFFGRVDVEIQASPGAGIVSSAVLESDDLDEIDWEWVGADNKQAQTNYFSKGVTGSYNRGGFSPVTNPTGSFHTYSVEWTSSKVDWLIDDKVVRTLTPASAKASGNGYPSTPMQIKLGSWCTQNSPEGTKQWAGGETDFSKGPFETYYKSITITDYAGKDSPASGGVKSYSYGDHSGSADSIKVEGGSSDSDSSDSGSSSSATGGSSSTGTASATGTKTSNTTMATSMTSATESSGSSSTGSSDSGSASSSGTPTDSGSSTGSSSGSGTSAAASPSKTAGASRSVVALGGAILAGVVAIAQFL